MIDRCVLKCPRIRRGISLQPWVTQGALNCPTAIKQYAKGTVHAPQWHMRLSLMFYLQNVNHVKS